MIDTTNNRDFVGLGCLYNLRGALKSARSHKKAAAHLLYSHLRLRETGAQIAINEFIVSRLMASAKQRKMAQQNGGA